MKKHNFYAGPAILADEVIQGAAEAAKEFKGTGLSLLEVSHRSKEVMEFILEAEVLAKKLLGLPEGYHVLFMTGGASTQFFMAPMNILRSGEKCSMIDTGAWSKKAIKEAKLYGEVEISASSSDKNYNYIPTDFQISDDSVYVHLTTNNTIFGTQFNEIPDFGKPLVADMSSDIFSRPLPVDRFGLFYAGAQKNLGPAGTTLVIVRDDMVERTDRTLTSMCNYRNFIEKNSLYNTGPVFPIYVCYLTLKWLQAQGGVSEVEKKNNLKASELYTEIDRNGLFQAVVPKESDRSKMNVTFVLKDDNLTPAFLEACDKANIVGIKGHRSVGGFRASIYNAMKIDSVRVLIDVMKYFEQKNG